MKPKEFDIGLRKQHRSDGWPFLCDGSPFDCPVFLVGHNPRSTTPFWEFWDGERFDKSAWLAEYLRREQKFGRTRQMIEALLDGLSPTKCLETNLYSGVSDRLKDLPSDHRNSDIFHFLLSAIKPSVLLAHGKRVREDLQRLSQTKLTLNEFNAVEIYGGAIDILPTHHLSYQLSVDDCTRIGQRLRQRVASTT